MGNALVSGQDQRRFIKRDESFGSKSPLQIMAATRNGGVAAGKEQKQSWADGVRIGRTTTTARRKESPMDWSSSSNSDPQQRQKLVGGREGNWPHKGGFHRGKEYSKSVHFKIGINAVENQLAEICRFGPSKSANFLRNQH